MLSSRVKCFSSVIPTLVCSPNPGSTRASPPGEEGSSALEALRVGLAVGSLWRPRRLHDHPAASARAAAASCPPAAPDSGSGSRATQRHQMNGVTSQGAVHSPALLSVRVSVQVL